jgi:hypothetical protein
MFTETKMAGKVYITLNILRAINIISLILVAAASMIMLVMTVKTSAFYLFDEVSHIVTCLIALVLVLSEINLRHFRGYFVRNWPLLSEESGLITLGVAMFVIGFNILGNLNKSATSVERLGLPMWRVVISGGVMTSVMGVLNFISHFVFRNKAQGINARQVRSHGAAALPGKASSLSSGSTRRAPTLPTYKTEPEERRKSRFGFKFPIRSSQISPPIVQPEPDQYRCSPVVPDIQRPPTAMHPAFNHPPPPASSRYSVASNITRF